LLPPHIPAASVGIGGHDREPLALSSPIFATSVYLARRLPGRARRYYDGRGAAAIDPHDAEVPRPRSAPQFLDAADPHHAAGGDRSSRFDLGPGSLRHSSGDTGPGPRSGALGAPAIRWGIVRAAIDWTDAWRPGDPGAGRGLSAGWPAAGAL